MKHARKKPEKTTARETHVVKKSTTADYQRKYLYDDNSEVIRRQIANAGYKKRSLDSYIPADKLESKVRPTRNTRIDQTRKIDTAKIAEASKEYKSRKTSSSAPKKTTTADKTKQTIKKIAATAKTTSAKRTSSARTSSAKTTSARKKTSRKIPLSKKFVKKALPTVFAALFVAIIVLAGIGVGMYSAVSNELEEMNVKNLALNYSSFVYYNDENGNAVEDVQLHFEGERRVWVDSDAISINLKNAAVAIEDERFTSITVLTLSVHLVRRLNGRSRK